jgi:hypothetical protein
MPEHNTTGQPKKRTMGGTGHLPAEKRQALRDERARLRKLAEELAKKEAAG